MCRRENATNRYTYEYVVYICCRCWWQPFLHCHSPFAIHIHVVGRSAKCNKSRRRQQRQQQLINKYEHVRVRGVFRSCLWVHYLRVLLTANTNCCGTVTNTNILGLFFTILARIRVLWFVTPITLAEKKKKIMTDRPTNQACIVPKCMRNIIIIQFC